MFVAMAVMKIFGLMKEELNNSYSFLNIIGDEINEDEMDETCSTQERYKKFVHVNLKI
jgi:hypothetical protein